MNSFEQPSSPVPLSGQPCAYDVQLVRGDNGHAIAFTVHTPAGSSTTFMPLEFWTAHLWPLLERANETVQALSEGVLPVAPRLVLPPRNGHRG